MQRYMYMTLCKGILVRVHVHVCSGQAVTFELLQMGHVAYI